ncbi:MAG TPA: aminodeoxychorismate synthase component I [Steroidobacteraceae bacterium]|nr:aminodeoxychorismate synthase component I [Steroidobacteraceae bacterium]
MSGELLVQRIDPVDPTTLLALHAAFPQRYPAFFESAGTSSLDCCDILFACPGERLVARAGDSATNFLSALDARWRAERVASLDSKLPFSGGWLLFFAYDFAQYVEPKLNLPQGTLPVAEAIRVPAAIVRDRRSNSSWVVAESSAAECVRTIGIDLASVAPDAGGSGAVIEGVVEEERSERYILSVTRALEYIAAGDIYQANLSREWRARLQSNATAVDLFRRLRRTNPGPFSGIAALTERSIVTSSPERLVRVLDGWAETRPIAGTRPRGADASADLDLARELRAHPKEQAEHVMLIDLERNDLGRICDAGTVSVDEFMTIETYAHVHHIVSNVRGKLREGTTPGQVIQAVFPGGTITGCPKVRCMEIIGELEGVPRGAYTGSLGYLNRDGSMDLNILIRTLEVVGREITLRAGAGIVADSIPERELHETRAKARGLLRALTDATY